MFGDSKSNFGPALWHNCHRGKWFVWRHYGSRRTISQRRPPRTARLRSPARTRQCMQLLQPIFLCVNWTWFVVPLSFEFGLIWCSVCFDDMQYGMAQRWTDGLGNRPGFHHLYRGCQSISIGSSVVCPLLFDAAHARYRFPIRHSRGRHHVYCGSQDFPTCAQRDTHRSVFFNRWREFNRFFSISFFLPMWNAIDCLFKKVLVVRRSSNALDGVQVVRRKLLASHIKLCYLIWLIIHMLDVGCQVNGL